MNSSESIPPSNPNNAPEAPTDMVVLWNKDENKLPPIPANIYSGPILTVQDLHFIIYINLFRTTEVQHDAQ